MARTPTVAVIVAALLAWVGVGATDDRPVIDPDVRAGTGRGPLRVLVELRVPGADASAIGTAQDEVLRRLAGTSARLARRYSTAPLLALEIDAPALARLQEMRDVVVRVRADRISQPFDGPAPPRGPSPR